MATLSQTIRLNDQMTSRLMNINSALSRVTQGFEKMQEATDNPMNVAEFEFARNTINDVGAELQLAQQEQEIFNQKIQKTTTSSKGLLSTIKGFVGAYAVKQAGSSFIGGSDSYTSSIAKLNLMNDGLQTTNELNQMIFQSAQNARGVYSEMLDTVGKLGITASSSFGSNTEMVAFSELMTKQFKIAGASSSEQSSAMYQLTQAMAAGKLQGDEFRSITENAPLLAQAIATEMQVSIGELKELSSEGVITSEIIKSAMFNSADQINQQFETIPMTFSDMTTKMKNQITMKLQPAFDRFSEFLNSDTGQQFFTGITQGIVMAISVGTGFMTVLTTTASVFTENWSIIAPILTGVAASMALLGGVTLAYNGYLAITNGLLAISTIQKVAHGAAITAEMLATTGMTGAQLGLNAALYACPLTWIIAIGIGVIAVFYGAVAAVNKFGERSISTTGLIAGGITWLAALVGNVFIGLYNGALDIFGGMWNFIASFAEFFGNVLIEPVNASKQLLVGFADSALQILQSLATAIDAVFGSEMASQFEGWRAHIQLWADSNVEESTFTAPKFDADQWKVDRFNLGDAYNTGYNFGDSIDSKVSGLFDNFAMDSIIPDNNNLLTDYNIDSIDYVGEVGSINDTVDVSSEDLKVMRELAEMKSIQNFVTLQPSVSLTTGDINNGKSYDDIMDDVTRSLQEEINAGAKAVFING